MKNTLSYYYFLSDSVEHTSDLGILLQKLSKSSRSTVDTTYKTPQKL